LLSTTDTQIEILPIILFTAMSSTEAAPEQPIRAALEKKLLQRPDKQELIDHNILSGTQYFARNLSGERQHGD
jgi:hypothetical protein